MSNEEQTMKTNKSGKNHNSATSGKIWHLEMEERDPAPRRAAVWLWGSDKVLKCSRIIHIIRKRWPHYFLVLPHELFNSLNKYIPRTDLLYTSPSAHKDE